MMASPWDGASRRALRVGLSVVVVMSVVHAGFEVRDLAASPSFSHDTRSLWLDLARSTPSLLALGTVGVVAAVLFALRPAALVPGLLALGVLGALTSGVGALAHGPRRNYFSLGAAFLGWLLGLAYARALRPRATTRESDEAIAETGAVAALAATYVNAATSKLLHAGLGWADTTSLRGMVLSHHPVGDTTIFGWYTRLVVEHPSLSRTWMVAALALQATAFLYVLGPRLRMVWGIGLLAFHTNVSFLAKIGYVEARLLLLLFSFPWPRIAQRLLRKGPSEAQAEPPVDPERHRDVLWIFLTAVCAATALAWLVPSG
jgi:hypothetical protein